MNNYVHGYTERESTRLNDQANALDNILHHDSVWDEGTLILEAGCGVGAQTKIIAPKNDKSHFISIDISIESLTQAKKLISDLQIVNVEFKQADIFDLSFNDAYFDHIFVCFVLEHLSCPEKALAELKRVLKPNGTIMVIEGDHGSTYFHPDSPEAQKAIDCLVMLQKQDGGGDANIGRKLYPLLNHAGFSHIKISPRQIYVDDSLQELVEGFTKNTFTAMIEGISDIAIAQKLISADEMHKGIKDLLKTTEGDGTFCYTFFKGIAKKI